MSTGYLSLALIVGFLLLGFAALRVLELSPRSSPTARSTASEAAALPEPLAWTARLEDGEVALVARLFPLHDEPVLEDFRAGALRKRYALPDGRPWRLYLSLELPEGAEAPQRALGDVRVGDVLQPFAALVPEPEEPDPVRALLAAAPGAPRPGHAVPLVLWGTRPAEGDVLSLRWGEAALAAPLTLLSQEPAPRWYAGTNPPPRASRSLAEEVVRLQRELERERARRAEREEAFAEFSRLLGTLPVGKELGLGEAPVEPPPPTDEELELQRAVEEARARAEELGRSLAVLMRLEGLRGLDLMDPGTLLPGPPSALGPVVLRCLDERGLLTGSLRAERLRCEGSVAARTLTLVLEDGYESHGGERVPFEGGVRRITLREVDPQPWMEECPELFDPADALRPEDDGRWDLGEVRRELNRLLGLDTRPGWYRLHSLGGVRGRALLDVQLEELDPSGRLERRLFADTLVLVLEDGGVTLELEDGAFVRGEEKRPFRDGHHRVVLPGVDVDPWRAAALPGLGTPPRTTDEGSGNGAERPASGG